MKSYYFKFSGVWLTGTGVVTAETKGEAYALAYDEVVEIDKDNHKYFKIDDLIEIQTNMKDLIIIDNGDY